MTDIIDKKDKEKTQNYEEVILTFVDIIEKRDSYTAGHSSRVADYCVKIAHKMQIESKEIEKLEKAALLHDIGKIQTPDSILLKPASLSQLEYSLIKEHVSVSYEILTHVEMYKELAEIIRYHHERYDGKGYPLGLIGEEIPLLSRIMIVADAFDAMTTNRIYKPRKTLQEALAEIERFSGTQFCPKAAKAALHALKEVHLPQEVNQLPRNALEKERFSYFFKDKLTGAYNRDYLDISLNRNSVSREYEGAYYICLKQFSVFNTTKGWEEGNRLLITFVIRFKQRYPQTELYRVEGDDFIALNVKERLEIRSFLEGSGIGVSVVEITPLEKFLNFESIKHTYGNCVIKGKES